MEPFYEEDDSLRGFAPLLFGRMSELFSPFEQADGSIAGLAKTNIWLKSYLFPDIFPSQKYLDKIINWRKYYLCKQ